MVFGIVSAGPEAVEALGVDLRRRFGRLAIVERAAGKHRLRARQHVVLLREPVLVLDQQPLLARRRAHQRERALELLAAQKEAQLAVRELGTQTRLRFTTVAERVLLILVRRIHAAVPDDDVAGAVLLLGNHAFERRVVERVILDLDREALVARDRATGPSEPPRTSARRRARGGNRSAVVARRASARRTAAARGAHPQPGGGLRRARELALGGVGVEGALHAGSMIARLSPFCASKDRTYQVRGNSPTAPFAQRSV